MRLTSLSTASSSPSTRLVGDTALFPGHTGGMAAGLVLDPCLALVSSCWRVLKEPVPGLFVPPLIKATRKSRIHIPCGAPKRHGDGQISKACSSGLYVLLSALITRWLNFGPIISNQKFRQRSGIDQLLSQFTVSYFFYCNTCVITVHPPIPAHIFSLLVQYLPLMILITKEIYLPVGASNIPVLLLAFRRSAKYRISQSILLI